ncbi:MAG: SagB/ThcOx family dehydrogenase [bacterium]
MPVPPKAYHETTSYERNLMGGAPLDWLNQPTVYKNYPHAPRWPLPKEFEIPSMGMLELFGTHQASKSSKAWNLEELAMTLRLTCAITAKSTYQGGEFFYRSTPSAGALYPCEIYLSAFGVQGLPSGLYHYNLKEDSLVQIRTIQADPEGDETGVVFFLSVIFFRSSWKYRERAYRYLLLDTGHLLENLLLALKAAGRPSRVLLDFQDEKVNSFLGLDHRHEVCLAMVEAGASTASDSTLSSVLSLPPDNIPWAEPSAPRQTIFPLILEAHAAGCKFIPHDNEPGYRMGQELGLSLGMPQPLERARPRTHEMGYVNTLWQRRSKRAYLPRPLDKQRFYWLLESLQMMETPSSQRPDGLLAIGFLVREVEELACGFYIFDIQQGLLFEAARGDLARNMAYACLEQSWMAKAALQVIFLSNLEVLESRMGARAYRYAMILAGRMGQRIYLASTALGLGACGVGAFYDQEAARLLGLNQPSKLLYLLTSGPVHGV